MAEPPPVDSELLPTRVEPVTAEPPPADSELLPTRVEPVTAEPPPADSELLPIWVEPVTADPPPADPGLFPITSTQPFLVTLLVLFELLVSVLTLLLVLLVAVDDVRAGLLPLLLSPLLVLELAAFEDETDPPELVLALPPLEDETEPPELVFALVVALAPLPLLAPLVVGLLLDA